MTYITEDYCSKELTGFLKNKGYVGSTNICLDKDGFKVEQITIQSAMKWLREKNDLIINVFWDGLSWFSEYYRKPQDDFVLVSDSFSNHEFSHEFSSYEEACEAAIRYCLNLI